MTSITRKCALLAKMQDHVNYSDPGLSRKHLDT